ncbi:unnamed protein product [Closterium sp. Yama58-4]|nr:unnamed protein product [Closterium sp. Yama58-4]
MGMGMSGGAAAIARVEGASWEDTAQVLSICRTVLISHALSVAFDPLTRLFSFVTLHHPDITLRDRARFFLRLITSAPGHIIPQQQQQQQQQAESSSWYRSQSHQTLALLDTHTAELAAILDEYFAMLARRQPGDSGSATIIRAVTSDSSSKGGFGEDSDSNEGDIIGYEEAEGFWVRVPCVLKLLPTAREELAFDISTLGQTIDMIMGAVVGVFAVELSFRASVFTGPIEPCLIPCLMMARDEGVTGEEGEEEVWEDEEWDEEEGEEYCQEGVLGEDEEEESVEGGGNTKGSMCLVVFKQDEKTAPADEPETAEQEEKEQEEEEEEESFNADFTRTNPSSSSHHLLAVTDQTPFDIEFSPHWPAPILVAVTVTFTSQDGRTLAGELASIPVGIEDFFMPAPWPFARRGGGRGVWKGSRRGEMEGRSRGEVGGGGEGEREGGDLGLFDALWELLGGELRGLAGSRGGAKQEVAGEGGLDGAKEAMRSRGLVGGSGSGNEELGAFDKKGLPAARPESVRTVAVTPEAVIGAAEQHLGRFVVGVEGTGIRQWLQERVKQMVVGGGECLPCDNGSISRKRTVKMWERVLGTRPSRPGAGGVGDSGGGAAAKMVGVGGASGLLLLTGGIVEVASVQQAAEVDPEARTLGCVQVLIFIPPRFHVVMRLEVGAAATVIRFRTDYWPCLVHVDEYLETILPSASVMGDSARAP